jgi:MFS family permease
MLIGFAVVAGLALSISNPVTNAVIVGRLRPGERGTVMGLKQAGVPTIGALMSLTLPAAAVAFGWRGVVLAAAAVVLVLAPVVTRAGTGPRAPGAGAPEQRASLGIAWIGVYAFMMGAAGGSTTLYLPLYGHEVLGLSVAAAGAAAGASQITAIASRVAWSRMTERAADVSRPLALVSLCAIAAVVPLAAAQVGGAGLFWLGAVGIGAGMLGWTPVAMLAGIRLVDPSDAGRASGLVVAGFYSGIMIGPALFGRLVDTTGEYDLGWLLVGAVFGGAAALALSGGRRRGRPAADRPPAP